ncbi:alkaline phosphatase family protein [Serratia quinivorans]|nr:alkaline phosphatase family protein [Serratia quinivorans]
MKNVVVIYAENRSFNNLFANFPGVEKAMAALSQKSLGDLTGALEFPG